MGRPPKQLVDGKYLCSLCKEYKDPSDFAKMIGAAHGYQSRCKQCKGKEYLSKHPTKIKVISKVIVCNKCGAEKERDDFSPNRRVCKVCTKETRHIYYGQNKEKFIKKAAERYDNNRESILQQHKENYAKNSNERKASAAEYRASNRERIRLSAIEYRKTHRSQINEYIRNRKNNDATFKAMSLLKARFCEIVGKKLNGSKTQALKKFVGITFEELKDYLESKFSGGMTWENHGTYWHIDHIVPCAAFDATDPDQVAICFHYSNLQPLLGSVNTSKQDRLPNGILARTIRGDMNAVMSALQ